MIRCATCRALASEWAGWCPGCGRTFDDPVAGVATESGPEAKNHTAQGVHPVGQATSVTPSGTPSPHDDLPLLGAEPPQAGRAAPTGLRDTFSRVHHRAATHLPSLGALPGQLRDSSPRPSPVFVCIVPVGRAGLAATVGAWWAAGARAGYVTVRGRLKLGPPTGDGSTGWAMTGRFRRSIPPHSVPVVVELWPLYGGYARMTLTPRGHVIVSRAYFRFGHSVLDRLVTDLAQASTAQPAWSVSP